MHSLARQETAPRPHSCSIKKKAILLVEPDLDVRLMLNMLLTEDGCKVDSFGTLAEAVFALSEKTFDFVIAANGAPDIDGLLLLDLLREQGSEIPSVLISTRYEKGSHLLAMNLGALDYLVKPLDYAALQSLIHSRP
jgi:DNA-binding response OmpR family regulator